MTYKHLLVHVDGSERAAERLDLAVNLAKRWGARLTGLFAEGQTWPPPLVKRPKRRPPTKLHAAAAAFQEKVRAARLDSEWWHVPQAELDVGGVAARFCRYADLAILGQPDPEEDRVPMDLAPQVLLESGRPVLLIPSAGHFQDVGQRVLVEWNGSREAARALNDAIPLMREAKEVLVVAFETRRTRQQDEIPAADVVRHLAAHGITAQSEALLVVDRELRNARVEVLDMLLNRSSDFGSDLVVMGGRGRHGVPFPRPGRSTRKSLRTMTAPVLLSH